MSSVPVSWFTAAGAGVVLGAMLLWASLGKPRASVNVSASASATGLPVHSAAKVSVQPAATPADPAQEKRDAALNAFAAALESARGAGREGALSSAAHALELEDALSILATVPEGGERGAILSGIMDALIERSASDGALLFAALPETDRTHRLANQLVNVWAEQNPAEAAAWTAHLPGGGARDDAIIAVAQSWLKEDASACSSWLMSLPDDATRDRALLLSAQQLAERDPGQAAELARKIGEAKSRAHTLETLQRLIALAPAAVN